MSMSPRRTYNIAIELLELGILLVSAAEIIFGHGRFREGWVRPVDTVEQRKRSYLDSRFEYYTAAPVLFLQAS